MKKLFTALLLLVGLVSFSQTTGYFRYDSVRFEKVGGNSELIILNSTRNVTGGVLTNLGNGRTGFVTPSGGGGSGSGIGAVYTQYGITKVNDSTVRADTTVGTGLIGWPRLAKFRDSIFTKIPVLAAGTNVTITGTFPIQQVNSLGDTNWVRITDYQTGSSGIPNDGLSDTAAIKAAVATGKNVYIDPGEWVWDGYRCTLNSNQIIRGYGPTSIIRFTQDIVDVFHIPQGTHHVQIDYIKFIGKGRGAAPGGEVFTLSNAIFIQGDSNRVQYCDFKAVKGSGIHLWVASGTMYANEVSYSRFDSCGVGIYALNNAEYSLFLANQAYYCRWGFYERCAGNNTWDAFTSNYNDLGFGLLGSSGCNGDHGSVSNARINHNTAALDVRQCNNEYLFSNVKFYNGTIAIGSLDTAKRVLFDNCVLSGNTFTVTKALNCQFTGGTFGTSAVTIVGSDRDEYFNFCNVQNSPYSSIVCGTVMGTPTLYVQASDSIRTIGLGKVNDSTNWKIKVRNVVSGAEAYANWLYAGSGGGGGMTNPMTTADDIIYSTDGSGTPGRLAKGADGTFLGVSGGALGYYTPPGSGGITIGTTTITSGTNTRILYNNSGVAGEYTVTGSGTTVPLSTSPTFTTDITTPLIIGGTGATSKVTHKSTTGTGTGTAVSHDFLGGTNGNIQNAQFFNNGSWALGTSAGFDGYGLTKLPNGNGGWLDRDQFGNNIRLTTHQGFSTFSGISALTNTAAVLMKYTYLTTGTVANGLGIGVQFETENGSGTQKITGQLDNIYTDITNTSEDADFVVRLIRAGTLTEAARFTSVGGFSINGSVGTSGQVLTSGGAGAAATWSSVSTASSGTYTPTISSTTNVSSSTGARGFYIRVGDVVEGTIAVNITPTSSSVLTTFSFTLPVASNFTTGVEGAGDGGADGSIANHLVLDTTNDLLTGGFTSTGTIGVWYTAHFKYTVQ